MSKEISKALAIEEGRIFIPYDRQRNTREDQILLLIDIKDTKTPDQPSSFALRHSLDKIIISKSTSAIPIGTRTSDLDTNYGAPENRKSSTIFCVKFFQKKLFYLITNAHV